MTYTTSKVHQRLHVIEAHRVAEGLSGRAPSPAQASWCRRLAADAPHAGTARLSEMDVASVISAAVLTDKNLEARQAIFCLRRDCQRMSILPTGMISWRLSEFSRIAGNAQCVAVTGLFPRTRKRQFCWDVEIVSPAEALRS